MSELLTPDAVVDYLRARRVLAPTEQAAAEELSGGVSSVALIVRGESRAVVVKQALPKLRVRADWRASPRRTLTEAAALQTYGRLTPAAVPAVIDVDDERVVLTMEALPDGLRCWKPLLLAGEVDPSLGTRLGGTLAAWHARTAADGSLRAPFADRSVFHALRVAPFYETTAARHPDLAPAIEATADRMLGDRRCLVHGDFSPKNVLVEDGRAVVLDCEVAHEGDPSFDLAFMLHHLAVKSVARPGSSAALLDCAERFLRAYARGTPELPADPDHLVRQTACLMLARVDGKSPVDYLDESGQERVRALVRTALGAGPPPALATLWGSG